MYIPKHFAVHDQQEIIAFIKANAFGQLVTQVEGRLFASHMPFLLSDDQTSLIGHLARQNPQHAEVESRDGPVGKKEIAGMEDKETKEGNAAKGGQEALVILTGPHDYISPTWYNDPGVPTWNYQAVHITGRCRTFTDTARLQSLVETLSAIYESGSDTPWQPHYNPAMLNAIVGIEISIDDIQCKYKLSQNRSLTDRQQVIGKLEDKGSSALANAMARALAAQQ